MRVRVSATARTGELAIPVDIQQAGWWDGGSRLGDPYGGIVVAAHVDSFTQGLGRFAQLLSMRPGDVVTLTSKHLQEQFRVVSADLVPKSSLSASSDVFSARGRPRLVLITCGGAYTPAGGYQSNMVVTAAPVGRPVAVP
jgi:sortase (surface protein transpeptidase)